MPYRTIFKFLISGSTVAVVDLVCLIVLVKFFKVAYLPSSAIAFVLAVAVSFVLQKFWTFENHSTDRMERQMIQYVGVALFNLGGNTLGMYILVDFLSIQYVVAQIVLMLFFAIISFVVYRRIFK